MGLNTKEVSRDEHKDIQESFHGELASHPPRNSPIKKRTQDQQDEEMQRKSEPLKCPRCDSTNTKFCYYNNYNKLQPRHFCKACKRHWTRGGILRNVPVGGGIRKNKRLKFSDIVAPNTTATTTTTTTTATTQVVSVVHDKNRTNESSDVNGMTLNEESGNFMASSTVSPMLHNHDLQIWQSGFESFETNQCSNPSFVHSSSFISNIVDEANSLECIDKSITNSSLNEHPWTTLINWDMLNVADFSWDWQDVDRAGASELMIPWDDVDTRLIP